MIDRILSVATAIAVGLQVIVGVGFLGTLAAISLMAFSVIPSAL